MLAASRSKRRLRDAELAVGDETRGRFKVEYQNAVDIPAELERALRSSEQLRERWATLSAGKQRGFAHRISSAKREETRRRRTSEAIKDLLDS